MRIFGQEYSHEDLLRYSNASSIYGARRVELIQGRGRGQRLVEVKTAAGLRATFLEDRCLDICELEYQGVNLGFLSKNGIISTALANPETDSFTKYWSGGFLSTCGLRNTGPSCTVGSEFFPTHGHIGITPAEYVNLDVTPREVVISGKMRETALFGPCLEMTRKITIPSDGAKIIVKDTIRNLTPEAETIFLLYHINFGFPFLGEDLELYFPEGDVKGRTPEAEEAIDKHTEITPPIDEEPELVYFHLTKQKRATVNLTNQRLGINATIQYDSTKLPILAQWKCMRSGDYALGIEPGTSFICGRKAEIENGYDTQIEGFGTLECGFTINLDDI